MRCLIDADACPVVAIAVKLCRQYGVECVLYCDTCHRLAQYDAAVVTVSKGSDSADYAVANDVQKGDVVITQDYGLAAMCLARGAQVINQDGRIYQNENIDGLLFSRYLSKKARMAGIRTKGPQKRTSSQNQSFQNALIQLLEASVHGAI